MNSSSEGHPGRILTLYHQTGEANATLILQGQKMLRGSAGTFGAAIYFAEKPEHTNSKAHSYGVILQAKVKVGKSLIVLSKDHLQDYTFSQLNKMGFDSVLGKCFPSGNEYIVYNWGQVIDIKVYSSSGGYSSTRPQCRYGKDCYMRDPDHIQDFHPPGDHPVPKPTTSLKELCRYGNSCYRQNPDHVRRCHPPGPLPAP